jgi:hypothetical protein
MTREELELAEKIEGALASAKSMHSGEAFR